MTGLTVLQHPYQCLFLALMPFLPLSEYSLCGYEHKLFHSINLHIFAFLYDANVRNRCCHFSGFSGIAGVVTHKSRGLQSYQKDFGFNLNY